MRVLASEAKPHRELSISVVVAAYTMQRWDLLRQCMDSLFEQTLPPCEVVLCIDNNEELFQRAAEQWGASGRAVVIRNPDDTHLHQSGAHARAHGGRRRFGAGGVRNAAIEVTSADVVAIIDDDAYAEPDWLEQLLVPYQHESVVAVGGPPLPVYETARPAWFPRSFDWVFGCEYDGLPEQSGPIRHLIGANMSFRRSAFDKVGGFGSIDFDDLDICMKLGHEFGYGSLQYEPAARVHHFVPADRVSWRYFWRRCLYVNAEKVEAFRDMDEAANLTAEVHFAMTTLTHGLARELSRVLRGDLAGLQAAAAIVCGLGLAGVGNVWGRVRSRGTSMATA